MIHPDMPAVEYHALPAVSASMLINCHKKCSAYAWAYSSLNPARLPEKTERYFDKGKAAHFAVLEPEKMRDMVLVGNFDDFRTKRAKEFRAETYAIGKIPILLKDAEIVTAMHKSLCRSEAAELLFGEGQSEVSYTWDVQLGAFKGKSLIGGSFMQGKARVDRLQGSKLIDLKTAESASEEAFDSAMIAYRYHMRAAWYKDGHREQLVRVVPLQYVFVVVENDPPHLVGVYECTERAEEWGRRINHAMLTEIRHGLETGVWRGYEGGARDLRPWIEHQYAEREEEGKL